MLVGEYIDAMGPLVDVEYKGRCAFEYQGKTRMCGHLSFVVGVIKVILRGPMIQAQVCLICASQLPWDILLHAGVDDLRWYTVDDVNKQG